MKVENGSFNAYNHISFPTRSQRPNGMICFKEEGERKRQHIWNFEKRKEVTRRLFGNGEETAEKKKWPVRGKEQLRRSILHRLLRKWCQQLLNLSTPSDSGFPWGFSAVNTSTTTMVLLYCCGVDVNVQFYFRGRWENSWGSSYYLAGMHLLHACEES